MKITKLLLLVAGGYVVYKMISKKPEQTVPTVPTGDIPPSGGWTGEGFGYGGGAKSIPGRPTPEEVAQWEAEHPGIPMPLA
jgi:hypothetical protein